MHRIPLSRAPLVYATNELSKTEFVYLVNHSQTAFVLVMPSEVGPLLAVEIEPETWCVTLSRLNPYGMAVKLDFSSGLASFLTLRVEGRSVKQVVQEEGSVPYILEILANKNIGDEFLADALRSLWDRLVDKLRRAHCSKPPLVEFQGREFGWRERKWLEPNIWDLPIYWTRDCIACDPLLVDTAISKNQVEEKLMWHKVHVNIIGKRKTTREKASAERLKASEKRILSRLNDKSAPSTRQKIWQEEKKSDPNLRHWEFNLALRAVKMSQAAQNGVELARPGRPRGTRKVRVRRGN